ncbi:hypothetical protein NL533_35225, partial [Klebsiella pneumoniae]|nr:hypothetical protein [Klebsiella pneumoniae]
IPLAGAILAFNDEARAAAGITSYERESRKDLAIKNLNLGKILDGSQTLEIDNFTGHTHGGGKPVSSFGRIITKGQDPEEL